MRPDSRIGAGGRWPKGVSGNPHGRPPRAVEERYGKALRRACSSKTWSRIVERAVEQALEGDAPARAWLSKQLGLDRPTKIEASLSTDPNTLTVEYVNDWRRNRISTSDPETQRLARELAVRLYGPDGDGIGPGAEVRAILADPEKTAQLLDAVQGSASPPRLEEFKQ